MAQTSNNSIELERSKGIALATCEALVNSMPKMMMAWLENNSSHWLHKIWRPLAQCGHYHFGVHSLMLPTAFVHFASTGLLCM